MEDAELLPEGPSLYVYVGNNPINNVDPDGLFLANVGFGLLGGGVDIALQLAMNGGRWKCVDWVDVGISAVAAGSGAGLGPS